MNNARQIEAKNGFRASALEIISLYLVIAQSQKQTFRLPAQTHALFRIAFKQRDHFIRGLSSADSPICESESPSDSGLRKCSRCKII
jgi:hypothetical protein